MPKVTITQVGLLVCFLLSFLSVTAGYSIEPVVIEFLYYKPCPTCPYYVEYYNIYLNNNQVVNDIQTDYGSKVSVKRIQFYSPEGQEKLDQYGISPEEYEDYWNAIIINYEEIFNGYANKTYVREIIDAYLMPVHDVAISSVVPASSSVSLGDPLEINVTVKNEGEEVESFIVTLYYNTSIIETRLIENLKPTTEEVQIFHWKTENITEGNYTISAQAEILQNETDTDDNWYQDGIVEVRAASTPPTIRHDIGIIAVQPSKTIVKVGEELNVTVTVRNLGTETESFNVAIYCNETQIGTLPVTSLGPNRIVPMIFVWNTINQTPGNYTFRAQAEQVENETNLDDNVYAYDLRIEVATSPSSDSIASLAIMAVAFSFGFFETFSPCLIILLSFVLTYTVGKEPHFKASFLKVMIFGIGFVFAALLFGIAFGLFFLSMPALQFSLTCIVCILAIILGLNLLGILKAPFQTKPLIRKLARRHVSYAGLLLLGFIFYFLDPCIAPILVAMLPLLVYDVLPLVLFVFCLGTIIPFIGIGIFVGSVSRLARITYRKRHLIKALSGSILIGYALYLIVFTFFLN